MSLLVLRGFVQQLDAVIVFYGWITPRSFIEVPDLPLRFIVQGCCDLSAPFRVNIGHIPTCPKNLRIISHLLIIVVSNQDVTMGFLCLLRHSI